MASGLDTITALQRRRLVTSLDVAASQGRADGSGWPPPGSVAAMFARTYSLGVVGVALGDAPVPRPG